MKVCADSGIKDPDLRFLYLSPPARHALLGMRSLAQSPDSGRLKLVAESARREALPAGSLAKVFQRLTRRGLLVSQRGPGGGYRLARAASAISLADIVRAAQELIPASAHCLLGNKLCRPGNFCVIHAQIIKADRLLIEALESVTLKELADSGGW